MSIEDTLELRFEKLGLSFQPGLDTTAAEEYLAYYFNSDGTLFGDDGPCLEHRNWTIVYVAPLALDRREMRQTIRRTIQDVAGVWPSEDDATDGNGQRFVYEFETFGGIENGTTRDVGAGFADCGSE